MPPEPSPASLTSLASLALDAYLRGGPRVSELAAALGVSAETVRSWRAGANIPRADHASRLQRETHGAVRADEW